MYGAKRQEAGSTGEDHASLSEGTRKAEEYVKAHSGKTQLTQEQFDALVSFAYNLGSGGSKNVLDLIAQGQLDRVASTMKDYDKIRKKDKHGREHLIPSSGLMERRKG